MGSITEELFEGAFKPILDKAIFEAVQKELHRRLRPRKQVGGHNFPFTGLLTCGECGGQITAQYAKQRKYVYYRCSKKFGVCAQGYLSDKALLGELRAILEKVALPDGWGDFLLAECERVKREEKHGKQSFSQNLKRQLDETETKLDKLVNGFLGGMIEQEIYLKKKEQLLKEKVDLEAQKQDFGKRGVEWVELVRGFVEASNDAGRLISSDDFGEIKAFVKKIGSNRLLLDKKVLLDFALPFDLIPKYKGLTAEGTGVKKKRRPTKVASRLFMSG